MVNNETIVDTTAAGADAAKSMTADGRKQQKPTLAGLVPYITQWGAEHGPRTPVIERSGSIGYPDERLWDRDRRGVLWMRTPWRPGEGRPEFGQVHALRQRRAMTRLLCQVCGGPADRNDDGVLWLIGEDPGDPGSWPDPLTTLHPPVCSRCARWSARACPHLRQGHALIRVREHELLGVRGTLYRPGHAGRSRRHNSSCS